LGNITLLHIIVMHAGICLQVCKDVWMLADVQIENEIFKKQIYCTYICIHTCLQMFMCYACANIHVLCMRQTNEYMHTCVHACTTASRRHARVMLSHNLSAHTPHTNPHFEHNPNLPVLPPEYATTCIHLFLTSCVQQGNPHHVVFSDFHSTSTSLSLL
jgi:hypothetical protein